MINAFNVLSFLLEYLNIAFPCIYLIINTIHCRQMPYLNIYINNN